RSTRATTRGLSSPPEVRAALVVLGDGDDVAADRVFRLDRDLHLVHTGWCAVFLCVVPGVLEGRPQISALAFVASVVVSHAAFPPLPGGDPPPASPFCLAELRRPFGADDVPLALVDSLRLRGDVQSLGRSRLS